MNRVISAIALASTAVFVSTSGWHQAAAAPRARPSSSRPMHDAAVDRQARVAEVIAVLERRIADAAVRRKAAEKLATVSDRELRLIAALSERMAATDGGPAAEIALFLITALLILS